MTTTIHRQIGRLGKRSADDANVGMLIKEVSDTGTLLGKLTEHAKVWREAWTSILVNQTRLADSFHDVYTTIPRTGDTAVPPLETDPDTLRRVAVLHATYNDLKSDMLEEVDRIDRLIIVPLAECKDALKPIKKQIDKREHKKLDYERFNKQAEHAKKKASQSDREFSVQSKAEVDLEKATIAYELADNRLREIIPPLIERIVSFLPLVVEMLVHIQFTLCQHSYSAVYGYAGDHGYSDEDAAAVIAAWDAAFQPVQESVESEIRIILKGKAVTLPMNYVAPDKSYIPKVNLPGRSKKPPPPPPSSAGDAESIRGRGSYERPPPPISRTRSPSFREDYERDESPPPPVPGNRPTIGAIRARPSHTSLRSVSRDESPPPPLPGPRPTLRPTTSNGDGAPTPPPPRPSFSSYTSASGSSGVTATPLAGLRPSQLRQGAEAAASQPEVRRIGSSYANEKAQNIYGGGLSTNGTGSTSSFATAREEADDSRPTSVAARIRSISANSVPTTGGAGLRPPPGAGGGHTPRSPSTSSVMSAAAGKKKPPPPPPKKPGIGQKETWVRATFAFDGQDPGDLRFEEGDRIRVTKKTGSTDDWWEGEIDGRKGSFPANYCEPV